MLDIQKEKDYGVLFLAEGDKLDVDHYEKLLKDTNEALEELDYNIKAIEAGYFNKNIIITIITNHNKYQIDLDNFIIEEGLTPSYKILALNRFNELFAVLTLYADHEYDGFELCRHPKDDHIFYCLKSLKKLLLL